MLSVSTKDFVHILVSVVYNTMKHYRAKPSAQLPKHMHILHCSYKLIDNHLDIVPVCKLNSSSA